MKYIFFAIATFFLTSIFFTVNGQSCKPDKSINDKFTRQKYDMYSYDLKGTWNLLRDISTKAVFSFVVVGDTQIVGAITYLQSEPKSQHDLQPIKISKGTELYIANNAASVKLVCTQDAISQNKSNFISGGIDATLYVQYELPIADLETFSQQVFDQILITFDGTPAQKADIKKKDAAKMQSDAKCLLTKFKKS